MAMYLNHLSTLQCTHGGMVMLMPPPLRTFHVMNSPVVTDMDLYKAMIVGCPQIGIGIKPCTKIIQIILGKSLLFTTDNEVPILDSLIAMTDGVAPGVVRSINNVASNAKPLSMQAAVFSRASQSGAAFCDP